MLKLCLSLLCSQLCLAKQAFSDWTSPLPLLNSGNDYYYVKALVGTPPQEMSLLLDIQYPYVQVEEEQCAGCSADKRFKRKDTTSFRKEREVVINTAAGELGQECISFGPEGSFTVENQTMVVMREDSDAKYHGMAGTLGLGLGNSTSGDLNLMENLKAAGVIDRAVFAVYLNIDSLGWIPRESSSVSFGSWNLSRYSTDSEFAYVPANLSSGNWSVPLNDAKIGSASIDNQPRRAIITSAESKLVVPWLAFNGIYNHICYRATCTTRSSIYWNCTRYPQSLFSDLTFSLGSASITLTPYDYTEARGDYCYLQVKTKDGADYWQLGTVFMKRYYLLFDGEAGRVGLALAKHESDMSPWLFWLLVVVGLGMLAMIVAGVGVATIRKLTRGPALLLNRDS